MDEIGCGPITYSFLVNGVDISTYPIFTFDIVLLTLSVYSNNNLDAGTYTVKMYGT